MTLQQAQSLTEHLLTSFGLNGWRVQLVNFPPLPEEENITIKGVKLPPLTRRRLGLCSYRRQTIDLSIPHVEQDSDDYVTETIAEEVAHALTPGDTDHGPRWRRAYENIRATFPPEPRSENERW